MRLTQELVRSELEGKVGELAPPELPELPAWASELLERHRAKVAAAGGGFESYLDQNPAVFRGGNVHSKWQFWPWFFYRFVGPEERSGDGLNYAGRIREASSLVLDSGWVLHRCPARTPESQDKESDR